MLALSHRVLMLGLFAGLPLLGCSDDSGTVENPNTGGGSAGTPSAGTSSGGSSAGGGAAGSVTQAGGGAGGASGTATGGGGSGGSAGSGGMMMIDPNGGAPPGPASGRHTARPSGSMPGTTAGYYEYIPPHYGNGALYPLLVFRHGVGENGSGMQPDLDKVLVHGPPKLIEADEWPEARSFVVLSVQHPGDGCPTPQEMDDFFQFALDNYDIDPKRVYLTGLSCGAIGSWNYLADHTDETVAGAVLICGDGRDAFAKTGCAIGKVPIWAFHGDNDMSVDWEGSADTINSLLTCTNPAAVDAKVTLYPGVGHDSWTQTYDLSNPANDIYAWLMSHAKP
jgi:poly(3-hydroxybutyrate) depolymerase